MKDNNKTKPNELIWRLDNADDFLKEIFKHVKPPTDAMTEKEKTENFVKAIMNQLRTHRQE